MGKHVQFLEWLGRKGGVTHTREAGLAGYASRTIAEAERRDLVRRIRRSWIVLPGTDAATLAAVSVGGRVTCVTAASALGMWVPHAAQGAVPHVAVPSTAGRIPREGIRLHWARGPAPIPAHAVREHPLNVLAHVATCLDRVDALAVWNSAARMPRLEPDVLRSVAWSDARARKLARAVSVLSDSGLETHAVEGLRALGLRVRQQVWVADQPVDVLVGDRLVVQLDGAHHLEQAQRRRDIRHDSRLRLMGYTVMRFDYQQVLFDWPFVESTITAAVAQRLHLVA
ncbi:DUF559 domain-containing protein [Microbacterium sp. BWT-B31]|uniref:endonuclease domain-containing protein n=1 Tax=Microbacterium sp. BWT-B31 TaxID=3232072 RepID=UPI0035275260